MEKLNAANELTDSQIDSLVGVLSENVNDDLKTLRDMKSNQGIETNPIPLEERPELMEVEASVVVDNNSGEFRLRDISSDNDADVSLLDIADDESFSLSEVKITEDMVKEKLSGDYGDDLSDDESKALFEVIMRYRNGEKFSVYNALPPVVKRTVDKLAMEAGDISSRNSLAKFVVDQFISNMQIDKAFIEFNDTIQKELQVANFTETYSEHRQEVMEVKLLESADKIEAEYPEKAAMLRNISRVFTDTYMMGTMRKALDNRKNRQFIKDTSKYSKICRNFNMKYENSRFKINNVTLLYSVLDRRFTDESITEDDIKRFIMLFCKECDLKDSNDILDHTFMYYTVQNILMLDYVTDNDNSTDFTKQLLSNTLDVIRLIKDRI